MQVHHEIVVLGLSLLLAWKLARQGVHCPGWLIGRSLGPLSGRPRLAVFAVGWFGFVLAAAIGLSWGIPSPATHDEFAYLLGADTFAQGRLTNVPHPFWQHFESMHIIQQPSYQMKYPPAQSLFLAAGQLLTGEPMVGVWITVGLASSALCWMLQAYLPLRWAVYGSVLITLRLCGGHWALTCWGGAVAAFAGALLFGGVRRFADRPQASLMMIMSLGIGLLANSRPFEGLIVCIPAGFILLRTLWLTNGSRLKLLFGQMLIPAAVVLIPIAGAMACYNQAVTGDWKKLPYRLHDETYVAVPTFLFQKPLEKPPVYRHKEMAEYYGEWERIRWEEKSRGYGLNKSYATKVWGFFRFFVGLTFLAPLIALRKLKTDWWTQYLIGVCTLLMTAMTQTLYLFPHYVAPIWCVISALEIRGMRSLQCWRPRGVHFGPWWLGCISISCLMSALFPVLQPLWTSPRTHILRLQMERQLESIPGDDLVFVQYEPGHNVHNEWVYNRASIDRSPVVWARQISPAADARLKEYFSGRQVWLAVVDEKIVRLKPLSSPGFPLPPASPDSPPGSQSAPRLISSAVVEQGEIVMRQ